MKKLIITISIIILSLSSCDILEGLLGDIDNPDPNTNIGQTTTSITSPKNGAVFEKGKSINVQASAQNPDGIDKVNLWVDNNNHSSDQSAPYSFSVDGLNSGSHKLFVRVLDTNGNTKDSETISITIKEPVVTVSKKFTVTSVNDDLDNSDAQDFITNFKKLNFTLDQWDKNVSKSELKSYFGLKQEFLYHTGHGLQGKIMTSDGSLSSSGLTVNTKATIVATCLTMTNTGWKQTFGPTAQIIMGYTKVSYDKPTDNKLITSFLSKVISGNSYLKAWYKSNAAISSLDDRWLAYVKEGSKIVEYSARTNNTPSRFSGGIPIILHDQVTVDSNLLDDSIKFDRSFQGALVEETTLSLTRNDTINNNAWPSSQITLSIDEAKNFAENELAKRGGKPANTFQDRVIPIEKCDEYDNCATVAYQVYYVQQYDGNNLASNVGTDYIALLIDNSGLASIDFSWSQVTPNNETRSSQEMLNVADALDIAGESISRFVRGNSVNIVNYKTVHGVMTQDDGTKKLVPAYEFFGETGERFVVNAITGKLVF